MPYARVMPFSKAGIACDRSKPLQDADSSIFVKSRQHSLDPDVNHKSLQHPIAAPWAFPFIQYSGGPRQGVKSDDLLAHVVEPSLTIVVGIQVLKG